MSKFTELVPLYVSHVCNNMRRLTTISLTWENYEKLRNLGKTGETFNDVLTRVLDQVEGKESEK